MPLILREKKIISLTRLHVAPDSRCAYLRQLCTVQAQSNAQKHSFSHTHIYTKQQQQLRVGRKGIERLPPKVKKINVRDLVAFYDGR